MNEFLEEIERQGVDTPARIDRTVADLSLSQVSALVTRLASALPPLKDASLDGLFSFVPNSSIGANYHPCAELQCRLARTDELSRFAALWADAVYLPFFPARFARDEPSAHTEDQDDQSTREQLTNDLKVIASLRPLVESGIVRFFEGMSYCPGCYAKVMADKANEETQLRRAELELRRHITEGFRADVQLIPRGHHPAGELIISIHGPEEVIPHGVRLGSREQRHSQTGYPRN